MGAACSSTIEVRYRDALAYLRSKACTTYTYLVSFRPRYKKLPHLIIMGESHEFNPSDDVDISMRNCSTFTGVLNEVVSRCSDPSVKTTVLLENIYRGRTYQAKEYSAKEALLKTPDKGNPFNVNRQEVILDFASNTYPKNSLEVVNSDIFYLARYFLIVEEEQHVDTLEEYTTTVLKGWLRENYEISEDKFRAMQEKARPLSEEYLELFREDIRNDEFLQQVSLFGFTIMVFLETNITVLFSKRVYNHVFEGFTEYFNMIEGNFIGKESDSRKRTIDGNIKDHSKDIGMLITYLSDSLNFHRISKMEGIVLISYGQHHAETFENMVLSSRWYEKDFEYGDSLPGFVF